MRSRSFIKASVPTYLLLAVFAMGSGMAYAYHDTLPPGAFVPGGGYGYDPGVMQPRQQPRTFQGSGEEFYGNWRDYGWTNPRDRSMGYSNGNTGTNMLCVGADCNFAR
jgi:hypothetical protein